MRALVPSVVLAAGAVAAAPAFQQIRCHNSGATGMTTRTQAFSQPVLAGSALVVNLLYTSTSANVVSVTDTLGNVYNPVYPVQRMINFASAQSFVTFTDAGTCTVSVTLDMVPTSSAGQTVDFMIAEYSGVQQLGAVVVDAGTGTLLSAGPLVTASPDEMLVSFGAYYHFVMSAGAGFTLRNLCDGEATADLLASAPGNYSVSFSGPMNVDWVTALFSLRSVAGDAGTPPDGGAADGGAPDAGTPDAGTTDAGTSDGGSDAGPAIDAGTDAGFDAGGSGGGSGGGGEGGGGGGGGGRLVDLPRDLRVGCGCTQAPVELLLLIALARPWRRRKPPAF